MDAERFETELRESIAAIEEQAAKIGEIWEKVSRHKTGEIKLPLDELKRMEEELHSRRIEIDADARRCVDAYDQLFKEGESPELDEWRRTMRSRFGF